MELKSIFRVLFYWARLDSSNWFRLPHLELDLEPFQNQHSELKATPQNFSWSKISPLAYPHLPALGP